MHGEWRTQMKSHYRTGGRLLQVSKTKRQLQAAGVLF